MNKFLKLSLSTMVVAALVACGGGDSSDVADIYVGKWKSGCAAYKDIFGYANYNNYVFNFAKVSASELVVNMTNNTGYADSECKNAIGPASNLNSFKLNIGAKTTFLGAPADAMVIRFVSTGETRPGFINADSTKLSLVVVNNDGVQPNTWSAYAPYSKQ
jgi:hypothetical protein